MHVNTTSAFNVNSKSPARFFCPMGKHCCPTTFLPFPFHIEHLQAINANMAILKRVKKSIFTKGAIVF